ncbi:glycosyltransferase [Candidatus Methanoperedens nitratireducens]|nr:glycosyltransferase [Candidatus Methanoperedens nitroreducens]
MTEYRIPKVSIIMSVYDGIDIRFLYKAMDSIFNQTFKNIEVIIVLDDVKREDIKECVYFSDKGFEKKLILLENSKEEGFVACLNKAIEKSTGDYIARMDSDDISLPNRIEKQVKFLEENKEIDTLGTFAYEIDEADQIIFENSMPISYEEIKRNFLIRNPFIHPTLMFRRAFFEKVGPYNPVYRYMEDYELWCRMLYKGVYAENLPEFLYMFRVDKNFYKRRSGFKKAILNAKIKYSFIKNMHLPPHAFLYLIIPFIVKTAPEPLSKLFYRYFRK